MLTVLAPSTPLSAAAGVAFMPSLLLAVVFRVWVGTALVRGPLAEAPRREHREGSPEAERRASALSDHE